VSLAMSVSVLNKNYNFTQNLYSNLVMIAEIEAYFYRFIDMLFETNTVVVLF
jgi:hypothetical protein